MDAATPHSSLDILVPRKVMAPTTTTPNIKPLTVSQATLLLPTDIRAPRSSSLQDIHNSRRPRIKEPDHTSKLERTRP